MVLAASLQPSVESVEHEVRQQWLPPDELTVPGENHSCGRRTSSPTAAAEPASPLAGSIDPARSECLLAHSVAVRLGDFRRPRRFRLVGSTQQLFSDRWPVLFQVVGNSADGHPIDARATFISLHLPQGLLQVFSLTSFLHPSIRAGWAFGVMHRPERSQCNLATLTPCSTQSPVLDRHSPSPPSIHVVP